VTYESKNVTHLVRLETVQFFPHRQVVDMSPINVETAEVTQHVRPESTSQVGTAEKATNVFLANSDRPLRSGILDMCIKISYCVQ
jgi:hypothetical protein